MSLYVNLSLIKCHSATLCACGYLHRLMLCTQTCTSRVDKRECLNVIPLYNLVWQERRNILDKYLWVDVHMYSFFACESVHMFTEAHENEHFRFISLSFIPSEDCEWVYFALFGKVKHFQVSVLALCYIHQITYDNNTTFRILICLHRCSQFPARFQNRFISVLHLISVKVNDIRFLSKITTTVLLELYRVVVLLEVWSKYILYFKV